MKRRGLLAELCAAAGGLSPSWHGGGGPEDCCDIQMVVRLELERGTGAHSDIMGVGTAAGAPESDL